MPKRQHDRFLARMMQGLRRQLTRFGRGRQQQGRTAPAMPEVQTAVQTPREPFVMKPPPESERRIPEPARQPEESRFPYGRVKPILPWETRAVGRPPENATVPEFDDFMETIRPKEAPSEAQERPEPAAPIPVVQAAPVAPPPIERPRRVVPYEALGETEDLPPEIRQAIMGGVGETLAGMPQMSSGHQGSRDFGQVDQRLEQLTGVISKLAEAVNGLQQNVQALATKVEHVGTVGP